METANELRYTPASLAFRDKVKNRIADKLRELAVQKTCRSGRRLITEEDMRASVQEAVDQALRELGYQAPHQQPMGSK